MSRVNPEVYTDIGIIIDMMPTGLRNKLSPEFIAFINSNKDDSYVSSINPKIPLNKQTVRKETKELMAIIYREYLCSASKREEMLDVDKRMLKLEDECKIGFDSRTIFVAKQFEINEQEVNSLTVKKDENYITKIINKIKRILKK